MNYTTIPTELYHKSTEGKNRHWRGDFFLNWDMLPGQESLNWVPENSLGTKGAGDNDHISHRVQTDL